MEFLWNFLLQSYFIIFVCVLLIEINDKIHSFFFDVSMEKFFVSFRHLFS